jgi:hypothetical protein
MYDAVDCSCRVVVGVVDADDLHDARVGVAKRSGSLSGRTSLLSRSSTWPAAIGATGRSLCGRASSTTRVQPVSSSMASARDVADLTW